MLYTDIYGSKFFYHGWFWLDAVCKHCLLNSWWWHCGDVDNGVDVDDGGDEAQSSWEGIVSEGWNWAKPQLTQTAQIWDRDHYNDDGDDDDDDDGVNWYERSSSPGQLWRHRQD